MRSLWRLVTTTTSVSLDWCRKQASDKAGLSIGNSYVSSGIFCSLQILQVCYSCQPKFAMILSAQTHMGSGRKDIAIGL